MIDHLSINVENLNQSKQFYLAALHPLGMQVVMDKSSSASFGYKDLLSPNSDPGGCFWLQPGAPATPRLHFAFSASSRDQVNLFYEAAIAAGGKPNGEPGVRSKYHAHYYAAFVLDPDGNNIEAVCHV